MFTWSSAPFLRLALAFMVGIAGYLYLGQSWAGSAAPWAAALVAVFIAAWAYSQRQRDLAATDLAGILGLLAVAALGLARTQTVTESRRPDHLGRLVPRIEYYRAVVDEAPVVRANTFATTLRVQAVRVGGRWQIATGGVRVSVPRHEITTAVPLPRYGEVWLVRGTPELSKGPANPYEFDYRRFLHYQQVYHSQFVHAGQYQALGYAPLSWPVALSQRAASRLDSVFRRYVPSPREYALGTALVLGFKDDIDKGTRQAYADTGTTHIMAVSGLQVGLLFAALQWLLARVPLGGSGAVWRRRLLTAGLGLGLIWSYALLTGLSASVLRATVMFTLVILAQAFERQHNIVNTLCAAVFLLLLYNPYLLCDVGFQLSFGAVLSIVYVQPRLARLLDARSFFLEKRRAWQPRWVQRGWGALAWLADAAWQLTILSIAAQLVTFPLGLYYFHQFPFSFLLSNLVAVPISSVAVYVGVLLLGVKGVVAVPALVLPASAPYLDYLPRAVGWLFEKLIWLFNEYIFLIGRTLPGAVVTGIHLSQLQTLLIFLLIGAVVAFLASRRLAWLAAVVGLLACYSGSRVAEARAVAPLREFVVYSIPHRSVVGFWQGAAPEFITVDSLPLSDTERTYRLKPSLIQRRVVAPRYCVGWRGAQVPARLTAPPDSAEAARRYPPAPLVLAQWRGLRVAFVSGTLRRLEGVAPHPADVVVLRRNPYLYPDALAAHVGPRARVIFDSSCQRWYVARQDSALRAAGFRTWDVNKQGAFVYELPVVKE